MQRYFVDKKENGSFILSQEQAHHILRVMRMNVKDEITICYNEEVYLCEITSTSPLVVQEKEKLHEDHELKNNVTLFYCLPKVLFQHPNRMNGLWESIFSKSK